MFFDRLDKTTLSEPLYLGLSMAIEDAIRSGALKAGSRLPTQRAVSTKLGLSIHTVSKAYERLRHLHLIDGQVGRGSFVVDPEFDSKPPYDVCARRDGTIDLAISRPLSSRLHETLMREALRDLSANAPSATLLSNRPNLGQRHHREAGVDWLRLCGVETSADRVIMTNGASHGMVTALSALTRPGDVLLVEEVTHHLVLSQAAYLGLNVVGIVCDKDGILPDSLERACHDVNPKALVLLPGLCNPRASFMPEGRRQDIARLCVKHGLPIIENDASGPVARDRPTPLAAFAPDHTLYLTTFSKCTVPGLRAGYISAPEQFQQALLARIISFSWNATPLVCELATAWVRDGTAESLADWQRQALTERYTATTKQFTGLKWQGHPAGLHVWLTLPEPWTPDVFAAQARLLNITVAPQTSFLSPQARSHNAVRVSMGGTDTITGFGTALKRLAGLLKAPLPSLAAAGF